MTVNSIEVSEKGKRIKVPAFDVSGTTIVVRGKWIKLASVRGEDWVETELQDPEACAKELKKQRSHGLRADILTFAQKLPATLPKYEYPMEWESIAAIPVLLSLIHI